MTFPKQIRDVRPDREASAPYNFVPLPEKVVAAVKDATDLPDHGYYAPDRFTGFIDVDLETLSPLYVRRALTPQEHEYQQSNKYVDGEDLPKEENPAFRRLVKNVPEFFYSRNPEEPVVPGSSLRGMLRSLLEIVSYGKVRWVNEKQLFFRTVDSSAVGRYYGRKFVEGSGKSGDGYRSKAQGGFWRTKPDGSCQIEECAIARVEEHAVATAFGLSNPSDLYDGRGPNATPSWTFQHRQVWVQMEPSERDHRHSGGRFLRYRKVTSIKAASTAGHQEGTLVLTGPMIRKHLAFVFLKATSSVTVPVPPEMVERFHDEDQLTRWQMTAFPDGQPGGTNRGQNGFLRDGEPVFFLRERGNLTFFGRAQMFRLPYINSPLDLVPRKLCRPEDIDFADALFGFVRTSDELEDLRRRGLPVPKQGSKAHSYASRVFVTDAILKEGQTDLWLSEEPVVSQILATPKPTAFQHYLVQTDDDSRTLRHYDSKTPQETAIRGHKMYWAKGDRKIDDLLPEPNSPGVDEAGNIDPNSTQHTQFRPIKSGKQFRFRVYFENLSSQELGALWWTLAIPDGEEHERCHRLGMGKPLGMGAVKLTPRLYLTDRQDRYGQLFQDNAWNEAVTAVAPDPHIKAFEDHVLGEQGLASNQDSLAKLDRIQSLLTLLEWRDSVDQEWLEKTRYLRIAGGPRGINEYKERPVLPDPLAVVAGQPVQPPARQREIEQQPKEPSEVQTGTVKWFNDNKGYGFIEQDSGPDVFVHFSDIVSSGRRSLQEGQRVTFTVVQEPKGPRAKNVQSE